MKVRNKRWANNATRLTEARRMTRLHARGLTRKSTIGETLAAELIYASQRKGFMRRFIEAQDREPKKLDAVVDKRMRLLAADRKR